MDTSRSEETAAILEAANEQDEARSGGLALSLDKAMADYLDNPGDRLARQRLSLMLQSLGPNEISEALAMIEGMPAGSNRDSMLVELIGQWATYDPESAIVYAQALPNVRLSSSAMNQALQGWARGRSSGGAGLVVFPGQCRLLPSGWPSPRLYPARLR